MAIHVSVKAQGRRLRRGRVVGARDSARRPAHLFAVAAALQPAVVILNASLNPTTIVLALTSSACLECVELHGRLDLAHGEGVSAIGHGVVVCVRFLRNNRSD